ncbi:hypothetical protein Cgig2_011515 [Carnegiea gigantea]|uniref:SWIM-type domain-containing protein n=1 Tax=Carnegiea gigantea TaxID=171969 RepID=A0A9Q1GZ71_9CARY|nr:hypothetical protein Cgig2_011515 [Carnegiea gigantea]
MLVHQWESLKDFVIPIYMVDLHEPMVESLDSLQKTKEKGTVQCETSCEPTVEPSLNEARIWADNLIVTPSSIYMRDPNASGQAQPKVAKEKGLVCQFQQLSSNGEHQTQPNASPSPLWPPEENYFEVTNSPRRPTTRSQTSPSTTTLVPTTPSSSSQLVEGLSQLLLSPRRPLTRSQTSPINVPTTPSLSQPTETLSQLVITSRRPLMRSQTSPIAVEKRQSEPSSVRIARRKESVAEPLNFDLGQSQIPELDVFDSDVDENVEEPVEEDLELDSEDSDFTGDEQEESDEVSLDEELDENGVLNKLDLEVETEQRMTLGHEDADDNEGHLIHQEEYVCFISARTLQPATLHWLRDNEPLEHWARFKFDVNLKCADNINNFVKSFNNAITKLREKLMLIMLEEITKLISECILLGGKGHTICWKKKKKLRLIEEDSRNCLSVVHAAKGEFDVVEGCTNCTVKLRDQFCDCKRCQITGLPCKHSARCILRIKGKLEDYCAPWFSTENYRKLYDNIIHPIFDLCIGRPEKLKRRESQSWSQVPQAEGQGNRHFFGTKRCKQCKQLGHNNLTYGRPRDESGRLVERYKRKNITSRRPVGRPRKTPRATPGTSARTLTSTVAAPSQSSQV